MTCDCSHYSIVVIPTQEAAGRSSRIGPERPATAGWTLPSGGVDRDSGAVTVPRVPTTASSTDVLRLTAFADGPGGGNPQLTYKPVTITQFQPKPRTY